jgi:hypothetical protein
MVTLHKTALRGFAPPVNATGPLGFAVCETQRQDSGNAIRYGCPGKIGAVVKSIIPDGYKAVRQNNPFDILIVLNDVHLINRGEAVAIYSVILCGTSGADCSTVGAAVVAGNSMVTVREKQLAGISLKV